MSALSEAARLIAAADGLVAAAGAGMGVDSGLPDFRGNSGFWRAYPALAEARITFEEIANPAAFRRDPRLAWGFYGHRLNLYRHTQPHRGFAILRAIAERLPHNAFVFTSNVDGQFQKADFDEAQICEVHGSIHHLQCVNGCAGDILSADDISPEVSDATCQLVSPLPRCCHCNDLLRPNVLMFGDGDWVSRRSTAQRRRLDTWLQTTRRPVVVEIGAGKHVPTVRWFSETLGAPLIRINPAEAEVPGLGVSLPLGGFEALEGIQSALLAEGFFA
ncbi:Sir2 family NAD-dependent protein deacetylase [Zoogloea sp. LCSB751]|uniref:SIR2 family NAD-dependent protein deacylase n=1 Tax=Zoogloea sp. LCSB751 TaxID=1965277 RepID=UPI0009A48656|nr:Sir2 family NAD-dependent protein deacetylase [Zoogloea sp. LCSB751]